jgi:hypothetical protein
VPNSLAVELAKSVRPVAISPWLFCNRRGECYFDEESCRACKWDTMWRNFMTPVLEETKVKEHFTEHDLRAGACQGTCRLSHAAKGCLSVACEAIVTTDSRSGLRVTAPIGVQSRVERDQRAGLRSRAWTYTS